MEKGAKVNWWLRGVKINLLGETDEGKRISKGKFSSIFQVRFFANLVKVSLKLKVTCN